MERDQVQSARRSGVLRALAALPAAGLALLPSAH